MSERITIASGLSRHRLRRSHPSYGELFCLALGMGIFGFAMGCWYMTSVWVEW